MKTINPFELQMLIDKGNIELIDVRPTKDFQRVHALMARSIPLSKFEPHRVVAHRHLETDAPLYIMAQDKTVGSLAACGLKSVGLVDPIVVEGGIDAWERQCLPTIRNTPWSLPSLSVSRMATLAGLVLAASLFVEGILSVSAFFAFAVIVAALGFKAMNHTERWVDISVTWRSRLAGFPLMERPGL
jgi:rhodanese-related sulfurtransferase